MSIVPRVVPGSAVSKQRNSTGQTTDEGRVGSLQDFSYRTAARACRRPRQPNGEDVLVKTEEVEKRTVVGPFLLRTIWRRTGALCLIAAGRNEGFRASANNGFAVDNKIPPD